MAPEFAAEPKTLWIHGPAGFGKTVLCANIVQHLTSTLETPTAHFFFSSEAGSRDDPFLAIRSWVSQVISSHDAAFRLALQRQENDSDPSATRHTIISVFETIVRLVPGCTFVLDGLDECTNIDGEGASVVSFLGAITKAIEGTETRLLVVSRFLAYIQHALSGNGSSGVFEYKLRPQDVQADIEAYSRDVVNRKLQNKGADLRTSLSETMAQRCEGQFLWIRLQGESLRRGMSRKQLEETVKDTPANIDDIYDHSWAMIAQLKDADKDRAFSLLRWAAFAERPLAIAEVIEAILVETTHKCDPDDLVDDIDEDYVNTEVVGLCGPLLEVKMDTNSSTPGRWTLQLPHFTVKQYLAGRLPSPGWIESNELQPTREMLHHTLLAEVCLRYINLPEVWTVSQTWDDDPKAQFFQRYATTSWNFHMKLAVPNEPTLKDLAMEFLDADNNCWASWRTLMNIRKDMELSYMPEYPLACALRLGLLDVAMSLLREARYDPIELEMGPYSAFRYACGFGMVAVVEAMVERGANVSSSEEGLTPLMAAAFSGRIESVKLLLEHGADPRITSAENGGPLLFASLTGSAETVQLLLEHDAATTLNTALGEDGYTPMHAACQGGHIDVVRLLLRFGPDMSIRTKIEPKATAFDHAVYSGNSELVQLLLEAGGGPKCKADYDIPLVLALSQGDTRLATLFTNIGANPSVTTSIGRTAMSEAAMSGQTASVRFLLDRGVDVDILDAEGYTALIGAAEHGHVETVKVLLNHGANAHATSDSGLTPVRAAVTSGSVDVLKAILEHRRGVSTTTGMVNVRLSEDSTALLPQSASNGVDSAVPPSATEDMSRLVNGPDDAAEAPVQQAVRLGRLEHLKLLLDYGASIDAEHNNGQKLLQQAVRSGNPEMVKFIVDRGVNGGIWNEMMFPAIEDNYPEVVKLLLDSGADLETTDDNGNTPLIWAATHGHVDSIRVLLDRGADHTARNNSDKTPLSIATQKGHSIVARQLLMHGADANVVNKDHETPLSMAAKAGAIDIVQLLLEYHGETNPSNKDAIPPLYQAAWRNRLDVARLLLDSGADIERTNPDGFQPLYVAVLSGHLDMIKLLLARGANIEATCRDGYQPLHAAALRGRLDVARLLISKNANIDAVAYDGATPLHAAALKNHPDIAKLLLENGANDKALGNGFTAMDVAAAAGQIEVLRLLAGLEPEADGQVLNRTWLHAGVRIGLAAMRRVLFSASPDTVSSQDGASLGRPLLVAAANGQTAVVKLLLAHGADARTDNDEGANAMAFAVDGGHADMVKLLLEYGADGNVQTPSGHRLLSIAARDNRTSIVELLLTHGVDANAVNTDGTDAMDLAVAKGRAKIVELLLDHGATATGSNGPFLRPLCVAIDGRYPTIARLLVRHGADPAAVSCDGLRPIDRAAMCGNSYLMEAMSDGKATSRVENDRRDYLGRTILFQAARSGNVHVVQTLLSAGADRSIADCKGRTPLSAAEQCGRTRVATLLRRRHDPASGPTITDEELYGLSPEDMDTADKESAHYSLGFCDGCLRDKSTEEGRACEACGFRGFFLCAACYEASEGCPDRTHEFWPAVSTGGGQVVEEGRDAEA